MSNLVKLLLRPVTLLILFCLFLYWELFFLGRIPLPADALVGTNFPWLDYNWGFPAGVPVRNPGISDTFSQIYLWKNLATEMLSQAVFPLWNKYSLSGSPLLANYQSAAIFPANLILLLSKQFGWGLYIFGSTLAAVFAFYFYIRRHTTSPWSRLIGSIIFATAGLMTTWVEFGTGVWAAAFIPILLFCVDKICLDRKSNWLGGLSLALTSLILAGHLQVDLYAVIIITTYSLFLRLSHPGQVKLSSLITVAFGSILGIGLSAIQLLPTFEHFKISIRSAELFSKNFGYGLIRPIEMIRLWTADFFGNTTTYNYRGFLDYYESSSFLGTLTLPLILPLFLRRFRSSSLATFFLIVFSISLLLVISNPLSRLIFSQPIPLLTYSYASRLLFVTSFAAAVLGSLALDQLRSHKDYLIWMRYFSVLLLSITIIAIATITDKNHQLISFRNSAIPLAILSFVGVASFFKKVNHRMLIIFFVLIIALDLGRYFKKHNPFVSPELVFPTTPVITYLQSQKKPVRIAREMGPLLPPNTWTHYRLESIEGYDPLQLLDYSRLFRVVSEDRYGDEVSRFSQIINKANPAYLDALNVGYFLSLKPSGERKASPLVNQLIKQGYRNVFEDGSVIIYQNPGPLDRAYFINKLRFVKDKAEMERVLDDPSFNPTAEAVVISQPFNFKPGKYEVVSMDHGNNEVKIGVRSDSEGFLVLADAFDPGWKSYLNGKLNQIYQVNGALRGIRVPAGENQIVFNYQPGSFTTGAIISAFSFLSLVIFQIGLHLTKRQ